MNLALICNTVHFNKKKNLYEENVKIARLKDNKRFLKTNGL